MVVLTESINTLEFPSRTDRVRANWLPIYIEPMVGSGERITIGVAVANTEDFRVVPVVALERLKCVYGEENKSLVFAAEAALENLKQKIAETGVEGLDAWKSPFEGVYKGVPRLGAGRSLEDIARQGLMLCASLVERAADSDEESADTGISESRLEKLVRERVIQQRANLANAFGREFKPNPNVRKTKINFVGQRMAANFGLLVPPYLSRQVKDAKAKLWDLAQIQEYLHDDSFNLSPELNQFELFVHRVREDDPQYSDRQIIQVQEAVNELEMEADRKEIRCRPVTSPDEISGIIITAEAA